MHPIDAVAGRIVGGSVCTRTAARSLRVSFLPHGCSVCTFDCVYCAYPVADRASAWPTPGEIGSATANALHGAPEIESLTISGPGDSSLHPQFGLALANVLAARQLLPHLPVRIATNGTTLMWPHLRRVLELADELIVRLDARAESIDRPHSRSPLGAVVAALGWLREFSVESVFVEGPVANIDPHSVQEWTELLAELRPRRVYVATLAEQPARVGARAAPRGTLEEIAALARDRAGLDTVVVP